MDPTFPSSSPSTPKAIPWDQIYPFEQKVNYSWVLHPFWWQQLHSHGSAPTPQGNKIPIIISGAPIIRTGHNLSTLHYFFVGISGKTVELWSLEPPGLFASILSTKSWLRKLFSQYFPYSVCRRVEICSKESCDVYKNPQGCLVENLGGFLPPQRLTAPGLSKHQNKPYSLC